ncbi:MAG: PhzF family phenazine biosynthesis protein, partial [Anaerolineales bacterium]
MPAYPFMQVDAFSETPLGGNPCAILFDTDDMDTETMLAIAKENNLSETAFVRRSQQADFAATYFTPAMEIPFAGHPTLATAFALIDSGRWTVTTSQTVLRLELSAGIIPVEVVGEQGNIERMVMTQRQPEFLAEYLPAQVL